MAKLKGAVLLSLSLVPVKATNTLVSLSQTHSMETVFTLINLVKAPSSMKVSLPMVSSQAKVK